MKKILSVVLCLAMFATVAMPAFAALPEDAVVSPRYAYIRTATATLTIDEDTGIASCRANCIAANGYTVEIECQLQQYKNSSWTTLKTWTNSGIGFASVNKNWAVYSGYTYRVYVTYRIRNSAGNLVEVTSGTNSYVYP